MAVDSSDDKLPILDSDGPQPQLRDGGGGGGFQLAILDDLLMVSINENYTDDGTDAIIACFEKVFANLDELRASYEEQE